MHKPVLLNETIDLVMTRPDGVYVDCTVGGGGHFKALAARMNSSGLLVGLDKDGEVLARTERELDHLAPRVCLVNEDFRHLSSVAAKLGISRVTGVVVDLGVSSFQLDEGERGFSYQVDAPLDMRMDRRQSLSALEMVNEWDEKTLVSILREYGEERYSAQIVRAIVKARSQQRITTTGQLAEIVKGSVPGSYRREKHPARRTFQALRIAVNDELGALHDLLPGAFNLLETGGRLAVITFHSLEDRMVKQYFRDKATGCICPPEQPVCICGHRPEGRILTRKPVTASADEMEQNPRARSAKLRVIERLSSNQDKGGIS